MNTQQECHLRVDDDIKQQIMLLTEEHNVADFYKEAPDHMNSLCEKMSKVLPSDIKQAIVDMSKGIGPDVLSISNLPVDPNLPKDDDLEVRVMRKSKISESCLIGLSAYLDGHLQTEKSSHQQGLIQQITPVKSYEAESSGRGTAGLPFHVENVFTAKPPSFLCLFCLVGEPDVITEYLFISDVIKYLDDSTIEQLKRPIYEIVTGDGFSKKSLQNCAVIDDMGNDWLLSRFYEEDRIFTHDPDGKTAVEKLHLAIVKARDNDLKGVELKAGTLLIISNGLGKGRAAGVMHGRKGRVSIDKLNNKNTQKINNRWLHRVCLEISYHTH